MRTAIMNTTPRIYVASLTDYNNGILHGCWIDADQDAGTIQDEINDMLAESPTTAKYPDQVAEEWAIHDYEGFPHLHEYETIETVAALGQALEEHGDAMRAFLSIYEGDPKDAAEQFERRYCGEYDSHREFVWGFLDDTGMWDTIPEWAQPYFDEDAYWNGELRFDFDEVDGHYFSNN
jgi:antirestriction protein